MLYVIGREATSLTKVISWDARQYWLNGRASIPAECVGTVVHYGSIIVLDIVCGCLRGSQFLKIRFSSYIGNSYRYMHIHFLRHFLCGCIIKHIHKRANYRSVIPLSMLLKLTLMKLSLSGLLCSCHRPRAWNISWITIPVRSQPLPMEITWRPPIRPMYE